MSERPRRHRQRHGGRLKRLVEELAKLRAAAASTVTVVGEEPEPRLQPRAAVVGAGGRGDAPPTSSCASARLVCAPRRDADHRRRAPQRPSIRERRASVRLADGTRVPFDRLVLATGSDPRPAAVPGADLPGVAPSATTADVAHRGADAKAARACRGDRRRAARHRGRLRPRQAPARSHAGASDGPADGAPARCARARAAGGAMEAQGHRGRARRADTASIDGDGRCRRPSS